MQIIFVSIFPEIFENFVNTSLIEKAVKKKLLSFEKRNPRDFCPDKHQQVDDIIYGWGAGLLMKAKPVINTVEDIIKKLKKTKKNLNFKIIYLAPSEIQFNQSIAHELCNLDCLIFVCGRYEGIDFRFEQYMIDKYPENFAKISIWQFVTLGWELPAMVMAEAIVRLIPGVIKEEASWQEESYSTKHDINNIEYPQYTRPDDVYGYKVPEILVNWHHKKIGEWRDDKMKFIK